MANIFGENMADKKLTVKSLRVLQDVDSPSINSIKSELAQTNQTIASLQGVQEKYWNSIADDNIITPEEKRTLYKEKQTLDTEYSIVIKNAENMTDYVDYEPLIEAYNNLNSYLAMIKVFETMSSNTKIDDRSEFYSVYDAYYQALNNVNQAILGHTTVGEIIVDNPDMITGLKAVASEEYIYVSFNPLDANIKNNIQRYVYSLNKGDGVWFNFNSQQNGFYYYFDRIIDGFPESDVLGNWEWKVQAISVYGKESEESRSVNTNIDTYGTWIPQQPEIITTEQKRFISFSFSQKLSSKEVYGQLRYGLTIQKPLIDSDFFYTPALDKIPTESETNYKLETTDPVFVTSYFSQSLPLTGQNNKKWKIKQWQTTEGEEGTTKDSVSYNDTLPVYPSDAVLTYDENGQIISVSYSETVKPLTLHHEYTLIDMPSPIDTMYKYKVVIWNKTTNQFYDVEDVLTVYARANSASDLVDNAITQNALAPDAVTADKIAAGTITAENIAAGDILAKGARAGMVSTEGLIVDNSAFLASKTLPYKWTDPETGEEKTYIAKSGEFFVGNSPDVTDNRDIVDFLHYLPGVGFWFKIKNFIVKGIATIIQNVFRVKKSGAEDSESFFTVNSTDKMDEATFTPARTVSVKGTLNASKIFSPKITMKEDVYASFKFVDFLEDIYMIDDDIYVTKSENYLNFYKSSSNDFESFEFIFQIPYNENTIITKILKDESKIILTGTFRVNNNICIYDNDVKFYYIGQYSTYFVGKINNTQYLLVCREPDGDLIYFKTSDFVTLEFFTPAGSLSYASVIEYNPLVLFDKEFFCVWYKTPSNFVLEISYYNHQYYQDLSFYPETIFNINGDFFAVEKTENGLNIYKWDFDTKELFLYTSFESETDFLYDKSSQKLYATDSKNLIIFDGTYFSETEYLPEFEKKLIAISDSHFLFLETASNKYFSVSRDDLFLPIISDDQTTKLNTWSAKLISESLETQKTEIQAEIEIQRAEIETQISEVQTEVDSIKQRTATQISMTDLGFSKNSTVSLFNFFKALRTKIGSDFFSKPIVYSDATAAKVTDGTTTITVNGGVLWGEVGFIGNTWQTVSVFYVDQNGNVYLLWGKQSDNVSSLSSGSIKKIA